MLTRNIAKPAVPYGGKYRIIDFPLSNCINSGIETVGVLTQYQPLVSSDYIGSGQPWDLDRWTPASTCCPPYQRNKGGDWYKGTANAIYQNMEFIERYRPEYVLVLSGDHIYKMDYSRMIQFHKENKADCTVAVIEVEMSGGQPLRHPQHRAGRHHLRIRGKAPGAEEQPGLHGHLRVQLGEAAALPHRRRAGSPVPERFRQKRAARYAGRRGEHMMAYRFEGYWKDVGTIDSLWEANMDLLNPRVPLDLADPDWRIYSRNPGLPLTLSGRGQSTEQPDFRGGTVNGSVDFSVLFSGVTVEEGAEVCDSIIMPGAVVKKGPGSITPSWRRTPSSAKTPWGQPAGRIR